MCLGLVADISNDYSCFAGDFGISSQKPGSDNCIKCMTDNRSIICQRVMHSDNFMQTVMFNIHNER